MINLIEKLTSSSGRAFFHGHVMRRLFVDIAAQPAVELVSRVDHLSLGSTTLVRSQLKPNAGTTISTAQLAVVVHDNAPYDLEWRYVDSETWCQQRIEPGQCHVHPANTPHVWSWSAAPEVTLMAIDEQFVRQTLAEAFDAAEHMFALQIGLQDRVVEQMAHLWRDELNRGGLGGRVYLASLAAALIVHLYRRYGGRNQDLRRYVGSLGDNRFRRINDFILENLDQDISLADLAKVAGISLHHFSVAFKKSTGVPPHRYLIGRRVHRAKELLLHSDQSIADIAYAVGFSSQSQLTTHFRKLTGKTPAQFRRNLL